MTIAKNAARKGLTLIELLVTAVAAVVVVLGVVSVIAYSHQGYNRLFKRTTLGVVPDAYQARLWFDTIVRRATVQRLDVGSPRNNGYDELYVYYYYVDPLTPDSMLAQIVPNKYARFWVSGDNLLLSRGDIQRWTIELDDFPEFAGDPFTIVLAKDVDVGSTPGIFTPQGNAVRIVLTLDNETDAAAGVSKIQTLRMTVTSTALRHNN